MSGAGICSYGLSGDGAHRRAAFPQRLQFGRGAAGRDPGTDGGEGDGLLVGPAGGGLAHEAVGELVSQAGWSSAVESLWVGVAMATWPMMAEQNLISFLKRKELRLGVEAKRDEMDVVSAEDVDIGMGSLTNGGGDIRRNAKEMMEQLRKAAMEADGYRQIFLGRLIDKLMENV